MRIKRMESRGCVKERFQQQAGGGSGVSSTAGAFTCTYRGGKEGTEEKREAAGTDTAFSGVVGPVVGRSSYG